MKRLGIALALGSVLLGAGGCATVDPQAQWQEVETITRARTDAPLLWEQSGQDARAVRNGIEALLADGISREDAVRIALLNNRRLQAAFENVGRATADLVQAGLLSNPSLDIFAGFPVRNGESSGTLLGFLSDLWIVPARRAAFSKEAEATSREVAMAVVATAVAAKMAYDELLYRQASLNLERKIFEIKTDTASRMSIRYEHGLAGDLEVRTAQAAALGQEIDLDRAGVELTRAQTGLNRVLSLQDAATRYRLTDALEVTPRHEWGTGQAVSVALENRLDLARGRIAAEQAERLVELERSQLFHRVGLGAGYQGDFRSANSKGPALSLELPIFDQNQARIAKAEYHLRQVQKDLAAAEMRARKEVSDVLSELDFCGRRIETVQGKLREAVDDELAYAEAWAPKMQLDFLRLLAARELEQTLQRQYLEALLQYRRADARLYDALWGGGTM